MSTTRLSFLPNPHPKSPKNGGADEYDDVIICPVVDRWEAHDGQVRSLQLVDEPSTLISAASDGSIKLWALSQALRPKTAEKSAEEKEKKEREMAAAEALVAAGGEKKVVEPIATIRMPKVHWLLGILTWGREDAHRSKFWHFPAKLDERKAAELRQAQEVFVEGRRRRDVEVEAERRAEEEKALAEKAVHEAHKHQQDGEGGDRHMEAAAVMAEAEIRRERRRSSVMRRRSSAAAIFDQTVDPQGEAMMQVGGTLPYQRRAELSRIFRQLDGDETWTKGQWDLAREEALARSLPNAEGGSSKGGSSKGKGKGKGKGRGKGGRGGKGKAAASAIKSADAVTAEMDELMSTKSLEHESDQTLATLMDDDKKAEKGDVSKDIQRKLRELSKQDPDDPENWGCASTNRLRTMYGNMWSELEKEGLKKEMRKTGANKSSEELADSIKPSEFLMERLPHLDPDIDFSFDERISQTSGSRATGRSSKTDLFSQDRVNKRRSVRVASTEEIDAAILSELASQARAALAAEARAALAASPGSLTTGSSADASPRDADADADADTPESGAGSAANDADSPQGRAGAGGVLSTDEGTEALDSMGAGAGAGGGAGAGAGVTLPSAVAAEGAASGEAAAAVAGDSPPPALDIPRARLPTVESIGTVGTEAKTASPPTSPARSEVRAKPSQGSVSHRSTPQGSPISRAGASKASPSKAEIARQHSESPLRPVVSHTTVVGDDALGWARQAEGGSGGLAAGTNTLPHLTPRARWKLQPDATLEDLMALADKQALVHSSWKAKVESFLQDTKTGSAIRPGGKKRGKLAKGSGYGKSGKSRTLSDGSGSFDGSTVKRTPTVRSSGAKDARAEILLGSTRVSEAKRRSSTVDAGMVQAGEAGAGQEQPQTYYGPYPAVEVMKLFTAFRKARVDEPGGGGRGGRRGHLNLAEKEVCLAEVMLCPTIENTPYLMDHCGRLMRKVQNPRNGIHRSTVRSLSVLGGQGGGGYARARARARAYSESRA